MNKQTLTREQCEEKLAPFSNIDTGGILLFIPIDRENGQLFHAQFGDGCIDYTIYSFDGTECLDEDDGGQMDLDADMEGVYQGDITKAVYDILEFAYGDILDFIPLQLFS